MTNEQRAHDLAILTLQVQLSEPFLKTKIQENESGEGMKLDMANMYMDAYTTSLAFINRTFPQD